MLSTMNQIISNSSKQCSLAKPKQITYVIKQNNENDQM